MTEEKENNKDKSSPEQCILGLKKSNLYCIIKNVAPGFCGPLRQYNKGPVGQYSGLFPHSWMPR